MKTLQGLAPEGANPRDISTGQGSIAQGKWALLSVIEEIREPLNLKGTSIAILRAMLSFLREDSISAHRDAAHICFASNAALARRAHVSIQTVERHVSKLVQLGLLSRRSSGNGKRWARRNIDGEVVLATGLSLMPLVQRYDEFIGMARSYAAQQHKLSLLRDKCATALARLKSLGFDTDHLAMLNERARLLFRRKPDADALSQLLEDISEEISSKTPQDSEDLKGRDHHYEGHKEPDLTLSVKKEKQISIKVSQDQMEQAFPRLCAELRCARSEQDCNRRMHDIAQHLRLGHHWTQIQTLGPALSFMILGYLLQRIEDIRSPRAYAIYLFKTMSCDSPDWKSMMQPAQRTRSQPPQ